MAKRKKKKSVSNLINLICNIIWIIFGGIILSAIWLILGLILCITIIGIPFGKQCFKFSKLTLAPFGKIVKTNFFAHPIINLIWVILFGWEMFIGYMIFGLIQCITIVGIPFGLQIFKFAALAIFPFGSKIK